MTTKHYPPYGKALQDYLNQGNRLKNDVYLSMGVNAWHWAKVFKQHQWVLVLPYDQDPFVFTWPVKGLSILAFDTAHLTPRSFHSLSHETIRRTAYALLAAKAITVRVIINNGSLVVYRRGAS